MMKIITSLLFDVLVISIVIKAIQNKIEERKMRMFEEAKRSQEKDLHSNEERIIDDLVARKYGRCTWDYDILAVSFYYENMEEIPIIITKGNDETKDCIILKDMVPATLKG